MANGNLTRSYDRSFFILCHVIESRGVLEGILLGLIDGWYCWFEPIDVTRCLGFIVLGCGCIWGRTQWRVWFGYCLYYFEARAGSRV